MSWISNFYEDEQYYAPAANYFQPIGPTKKKKWWLPTPAIRKSNKLRIYTVHRMKFSGMNKILNINKTNNIPPVNLRIKAADKKINVVFLSSRKGEFPQSKTYRSIEEVSGMYVRLNGSTVLQWIWTEMEFLINLKK